MNGNIIPFVADVKPNIFLKQSSPIRTKDDAKTKNGGAFSSVLASTTAKAPSSQSGAAKHNDKDNTTDTAAADDTQVTTGAMLQQATPAPVDNTTQTEPVMLQELSVDAIAAVSNSNPVAVSALPNQLLSTMPTNYIIPAKVTDVSGATQENYQLPASAAELTTANSQLSTPTVAVDPGSAAAMPLPTDPKITAIIQPQTPAQTQQQDSGVPTSSATSVTPLSITQPENITVTKAPVQQPLPDVVVTSGQAIAPVTDQLPASQTQQASSGKVDTAGHNQTPVPTVAPAPANLAQPTINNQAAAQSPNQVVVASVQNSKPDNNDDAMAASDFADTKTSVDQLDTTSTSTHFAGILDQHVAQTVQTAAPTNDAAQTARPDPYNIAGQIVEQARLITRPQNSEMIIKLKPEHLGELTMRIVVENGAVSASFHSSNPDVRAALEASQVQFKQDMISQGIKVNNVGIYASLDQFSANQQGSYSPQPSLKINPKAKDGQEAIEAVEATAATPELTSTSGIDYKV